LGVDEVDDVVLQVHANVVIDVIVSEISGIFKDVKFLIIIAIDVAFVKRMRLLMVVALIVSGIVCVVIVEDQSINIRRFFTLVDNVNI
jgi:hypothetical protein